jgi:hypothetical protein
MSTMKHIVATFMAMVEEHLSPGRQFVVAFRDYSKALEGTDGFTPVKGDESRMPPLPNERAS